MRRASHMTAEFSIVAVLLAALAAVSVDTYSIYAQSPPVQTEVDRTELTTDEVLTLTVTIRGNGSISAPLLPALEGVNIMGRSTVSQTTVTNSQSTSELVHEYRLRPTVDGPLTIGAVRVTIDGQTHTTDPITVEVHPGVSRPRTAQSTAPPATLATELTGQDYFVEAEIDNPSPRLGEQVIYTFRFYSAVSFFGRTDYDGPELTGFWSRDDPDQRRYRTVAAGRSYTVAEIRTVLFPTIVGPRTIESAELIIPGGFFQQTTRLKTPPVELEVQPLPPGALSDFSGAVGRFSITAGIDGTTGVVNEPLLLTVTLNGEGNIDVLPDLPWPDMPGWRTVDAPATTNSRIVDDKLVGTRVYERTLVPRESGTLSIPAISYTYFNPAVDRYLRVSTEPIAVTVFPGAAQDAVQALPGADRDEVERLATDIRHIKPAPDKLRTVGRSLPDRGTFWTAMGFPAVLLAGATLWRGRRRIFGGGTGLTRSARAHGNARRALESAQDTGADPYAAVGITLTQYIGDKLDQPASGKTHETLIRLLRSRGIEPGLIERVEACLIASEGGRFAPSVNGMTSGDELMAEAASVLSELERQFDSSA